MERSLALWYRNVEMCIRDSNFWNDSDTITVLIIIVIPKKILTKQKVNEKLTKQIMDQYQCLVRQVIYVHNKLYKDWKNLLNVRQISRNNGFNIGDKGFYYWMPLQIVTGQNKGDFII